MNTSSKNGARSEESTRSSRSSPPRGLFSPLLALLVASIGVYACDKDDSGDSGGTAGDDGADGADGGGDDGGGAGCSDACAGYGDCGDVAQCESLCMQGGSSCAPCLASSAMCGQDCAEACVPSSGDDGGDDAPADDGADDAPADDGADDAPADDGGDGGGGTLPDGSTCTASADCESGVCAIYEEGAEQGECRTVCETTDDCSLGLCCDGVQLETWTQSTCVNSC